MPRTMIENSPWRERQSFARISTVIDLPDLIETQQASYRDFLQTETVPEKRKLEGLQQAFTSIFPIKGRDNSTLEFVSYSLGRPKYGVMECIERGMTYAAPLRIKVRLIIKKAPEKNEPEEIASIHEEDIYLGEIPLMTERGTFVINGAEACCCFAIAPLSRRSFQRRTPSFRSSSGARQHHSQPWRMVGI